MVRAASLRTMDTIVARSHKPGGYDVEDKIMQPWEHKTLADVASSIHDANVRRTGGT